MKRRYFVLILFITLLVTGCGKNSSKPKEKKNNEEQSKFDFSVTQNFDNGIAIVSGKGQSYVIDRNFHLITQYAGNGTNVDGYILMENYDNLKKHIILNNKGETVFTYEDGDEYKNVVLADNGCLITKREEEDWQSSKMLYGIYSLETKKYVLPEKEDGYEELKPFGDNMVSLKYDQKTFFNTETHKTINFTERVENKFKDGYSTHIDIKYGPVNKIYLYIFTDNGDFNKLEIPYLDDANSNISKRVNDTAFIQSCDFNDKNQSVCQSAIVDLKNKKVTNLKNTYNDVVNNVQFTKDGYALLLFANTGYNYYYTVINKDGKRMFEPVKTTNKATETDTISVVNKTIYEGGYFITVQDGKYAVRDINNNIILESQKNEQFDEITDGLVRISYVEGSHIADKYYRELDGTIRDSVLK